NVFGRQEDYAGAFFVVAGEVVEIVFLRKNVGLGDLFAATEAPEDDRAVAMGNERGAAGGGDGGGFALAALLSRHKPCGKKNQEDCVRNASHSRNDHFFLPLI